MKTLRILSFPIAIVGTIFFFQGIGVIGGSFMTSQTKWAVIGGIMMITGVLLFLSSRPKR